MSVTTSPSRLTPTVPTMAEEEVSLIDRLLAEQRTLTAVERFSRLHDAGGVPAQARYYRNLLPLNRPGTGQQYAFEVDLDQCSGCKACVAACHALNGLEDDESWRSVGLLVGKMSSQQGSRGAGEKGSRGESSEGVSIRLSPAPPLPRSPASAVQRTVTTACHHCVDPGCLNGCPVLAYEKDPITGIVRHLDDQCIGCQYCVMKCPYEVPQYSKRLGIVRKCDMCTQRLDVGEAPACVQSCPNEAIRISIVEVEATTIQFRPAAKSAKPGHKGANLAAGRIFSPVNEPPPSNRFLPSSPRPEITVPTTRYRSQILGTSDLCAADKGALRPADPHWPLVIMLPLSQLSVGVLGGVALSGWTKINSVPALEVGSLLSFVSMSAALGVATLHLGQPLRAWKAFLGWRKSWFSREVIAFGQYHAFTGLLAALLWFYGLESGAGNVGFLLALLGACLGLAAVFCSVMLYADTGRSFWSFGRTSIRFFGSTLLLGTTATAVFLPAATILWPAVAGLTLLKLIGELEVLRFLGAPGFPSLRKSALLLTRNLRQVSVGRMLLAVTGGVLLPTLFFNGTLPINVVTTGSALVLLLAGEILERFQFFAAVAPDKMPGGIVA